MLIRCEKITRSQGKEYLKRINAQCTELLMQFIVKVFKVVVEKKSTPTSTCEYYPFIRVSQVHHFFFFFGEGKSSFISLPGKGGTQFFASGTVSSVQSLSHVWLFATPCTAHTRLPVHHQFLELIQTYTIELVIPSNHLILCRTVPPFKFFCTFKNFYWRIVNLQCCHGFAL